MENYEKIIRDFMDGAIEKWSKYLSYELWPIDDSEGWFCYEVRIANNTNDKVSVVVLQTDGDSDNIEIQIGEDFEGCYEALMWRQLFVEEYLTLPEL